MSPENVVLQGDCVEVMAGMEPESVDAVVCDPPYAFPGGFMSKAWDRFDGDSLDGGFLHWFAGFVDGEGCFSIHKKPQDTFDCQFSITLRADDRPILERIQRTLGIGTLSKPTAHATGDDNPKARFSVSSKADCVRLRDIFRAFPLRAKKAADFEEWSDALDAWLNHERGEWDGMAASRERLMASRAYKPEGVRVDPYQFWTIRWARQALRVLKPGGWLIAAGAPKRVHRMTAGLEDAGFEIRDMLLHCFASGFPKGKANLKPAYEPWVLARKPGPLRMLAIDECRIGLQADEDPEKLAARSGGAGAMKYGGSSYLPSATLNRGGWDNSKGRWPANVILTDPIFDGDIEGVVGGGEAGGGFGVRGDGPLDGRTSYAMPGQGQTVGYGDSGTYSRFFLIPKSSRSDREPILTARWACDWQPDDLNPGPECPYCAGKMCARLDGLGCTHDRIERHGPDPIRRANVHPTVKPTELMRHLVRLVTPTGGVVLDPFGGSGTTALAAEQEGFRWILIEREAEYVAISEARLNGVQRGLGLDVA